MIEERALLEFFWVLWSSALALQLRHHYVAGLDPRVADVGGGPAW